MPIYVAWVVDGMEYLDRGLTAGATYHYAVDAVRADVGGEKSSEVTFRAGVAAVAQPDWVEGLPVRVADGGQNSTEVVLLVADSGVPPGTLIELPTLEASPGFWTVLVTSESAQETSPAAPADLVHAAERVLRIAALDTLSGEQVRVLFPKNVAADPEIRGCGGYGSRSGVEPAYLADAPIVR